LRERRNRQQAGSMRGDIIRLGKARSILIDEDQPIAQQVIKLRHITVQHSVAQLLFAVLYFGDIFQDDPPVRAMAESAWSLAPRQPIRPRRLPTEWRDDKRADAGWARRL